MKDQIQEELDKNQLWTVRYGFVIILSVIVLSVSVLYFLKIDGESVLYWIYKNYFS